MRIDQCQIEWRQEQVLIGNRDKYCLIYSGVAHENLIWRLITPTTVRARDLKRRVRQINLRDPCNKFGIFSGCVGDIAVVGTD
jgi:hypothetical protein